MRTRPTETQELAIWRMFLVCEALMQDASRLQNNGDVFVGALVVSRMG